MKDFSQLFTYISDNQTVLPFNVGGLIQPGREKSFGHNNQDALSISVGRKYIAGVVCDGCGGTRDAEYNSSSFNEFGAQAMSVIAINAIRDKVSEASGPEELLTMVDRYLLNRLVLIIKSLLPYKKFRRNIEYLAFNMLSATLVAFVVTENYFVVFNYGDGICGVNSEISDLENFSGEYYSREFFQRESGRKKHCFNVYAQGKTEELDNIIIGTDGMMDFLDEPDNELVIFLKPEENWELSTGLSTSLDFAREFRMRVSRPFDRRRQLTSYDDRAVIILRRIFD